MKKSPVVKEVIASLLLTLGIAIAFGIFRYWAGFFVLFQGVIAATFIPWLWVKIDIEKGFYSEHPGFAYSMLYGGLLSAFFIAGEIIGIGIAQPWFEPLGWLGRVIQGQSAEAIFGIAYTGSVARNINGYIDGGLWILLNSLDLLMMFFFFWIMPWIAGKPAVLQAGEKHVN